MQIDSNIYFQAKTPDLFGSFQNGMEKGLSMKKLIDQDTKEKGIQEAYKAGLVQNPDGSYKLDTKMTMKKLIDDGYGQEAMSFQKQQQQLQAEQQKAQKEKMLADLDLTARLTGSVTDQNSYTQALREAQKYGLDVSQFPQQYDPNLVKRYQGMALTAKEQIERDLNERKFAADQADKKVGRQIDLAKVGIDKSKAEAEIKKQVKTSKGYDKVDSEFGKDYNEWTSGGDKRARNEIEKLEQTVARLNKGIGTTGGFTGVFGDRLTSDDVLKNRADVQQSAMSLIKTLLSGATSDKDREQIVNTLWNEADSTENNVARINRFVADMKSRADDTDAKARYFEQKGTLYGFTPQQIQQKQNMSPVSNNGQRQLFKTSDIDWAD